MALSDMPKKINAELNRKVLVYRLPEEISQSYEQESRACTLISILVVLELYRARVNFSTEISQNLVDIYFNSINQGNNIYKLMRNAGDLKVKYMNIPEALTAISVHNTIRHPSPVVEWNSFLCNEEMQSTLYSNIKGGLHRWKKDKPKEAKSDPAVVILANLRAVVLIFSIHSGLATLMDSHSHYPYGAVIATAPMDALDQMCYWYARTLTKDTGPVECYELSFIYCR